VTAEEAATASEESDSLFVWIDPAKWGVAPPVISGKSVALIGNSPINDLGPVIDSYDEVIRINRMEYWQRSAADDGLRFTIWAGLPRPQMILGHPRETDAAAIRTNFPEVADSASTIWSATPFHLSVVFYNFLHRRSLADRLFVSESGPFLLSQLTERMPPGMVRALFAIPSVREGDRVHLDRQPYFELLMTGIRLTLFAALAGAREIGLFGFNFYKGTRKRAGFTHNVAFEKELLAALIEIAPRLGSRIVRYGQ
jgi:hypothetical protein